MSKSLPLICVLLLAATCRLALADAALPDPTRPDYIVSNTGSHRPAGFVLNATLISAHRRLAVINGKSVVVGDHVSGARVLAIMPGAVALRVHGKRVTVELLSVNIKRISKK